MTKEDLYFISVSLFSDSQQILVFFPPSTSIPVIFLYSPVFVGLGYHNEVSQPGLNNRN